MSVNSQRCPLVSVIIPTYRRFEVTLNTVEEVLGQNYSEFEVIVIDQNPAWPGELTQRLDAVKRSSKVKWIIMNIPSVVHARNTGVSNSKGDILLFIDDDVILSDPEFIAKHVANYIDSNIDMVTAYELTRCEKDINLDLVKLSMHRTKLQQMQNETLKSWHRKNPLYEVISFPRVLSEKFEVCSFCTCNGSIRRTKFFMLGGFDENFTGNSYGDDYDLAIRAKEMGMKIIYDPTPSLLHLQSPTGGLRISDKRNTFSERERAISALIFVIRYIRYGMIGHLLWNHLLRKTILVKHNITNPWRHLKAWAGLISAIPVAIISVLRGPKRGV